MKKILILAEYYDPFIMGGAEISLKEIVDGLIEKGNQVYVLTPNCANNETTIIKTENLTIHRYKSIKFRTYKPKSKDASADVYNKSKAMFYLILNQVVKAFTYEMVSEAHKLLEHQEFDLIHINNIESMLALSKIKTDIPKFAHVRDLGMISPNYRTHKGKYTTELNADIVSDYYNTNKLMAGLIILDILKPRIKALKKIDNLIAINEYIKQELINESLDPNKIEVLYNPINNVISKLNKEEALEKLKIGTRNNILFVGSLTDIKGAQFIVPVAKLLPDCNFYILGNGPYKKIIEDEKLHNVYFMGQVKNVNDYYKACDVFFSPHTVHYGIGRVTIEAMMNNIPIVTTNIKGIDEFIVNDKTGIVVDSYEPEELVKGIIRIISSKTYTKKLVSNAKEKLKGKFKLNKIINKLENIYEGKK